MCAGDFVQAVRNFRRVESAAQHLGSEHADAAADGAGGKHFLNHLVIVIDGDVKILAAASFSDSVPPGAVSSRAATRVVVVTTVPASFFGSCFIEVST